MAGDTERLFVQLEARINQFEKNMAKAERRGTKTYQSLERGSRRTTRRMEGDMNRSTRAINRALKSTTSQVALFSKAFAAAFVGAGLTGFTASVRRSIAELSELAKVIDRVGLSSDVFQELQFGFELAGVAQTDFVTGMEQFTRRIGEASMGTGRLHDILGANGVALRDQNGEMRSSEDLLRDYADLIANAGSEQERMTLATEAFGRGGASFVNALKNGSAAFDDYADAAANAGGVIDSELLGRAEVLDDRITELSRNLNTQLNVAFVNLGSAAFAFADGLDGITGALDRNGDALANWLVTADQARGWVEWWRRNAPGITPGDVTLLDTPGDPDIADPRGPHHVAPIRVPQTTTRTTLPPGGGGGGSRNAAADAAIREAEAVAALIDQLEFEMSILGMSDVAREREIKLRQAGAAATPQQRDQIARLVEQMHAEREAIQANNQAMEAREQAIESLFDMSTDALGDIVTGADSAGEAFQRLAVNIALAAAQGALFNKGPLAGLFGGGGGGLLGMLFGGGRADPWAGLRVPSFDGGGFTGYGPRDQIAGFVHGQEYVMNAASTARFRPQLEAMNAGRMPSENAPKASNQNVTYAPVYNFHGTQAELDEFRRAAAQDRAAFDRKVIGVIRNPKYQRHLRS